ncbi:murein L,D-transpeptidase catalytic domain family protein [Stakelama saccharophila]|uniref:Murein L,D-transpeptidase catalytic domain family protein n=1 Tax=Stakelama saccharophila TaxID=3075605 RepID=A0ABZ0B6Y1_9SPHN|nr:murein L,D-transpeptidase catalytic domain family protein [Stakelama sp. W311]WNO52977.1 murein L,D-transpeptidase catalytic domain family protein [Stakelama sp. W311]
MPFCPTPSLDRRSLLRMSLLVTGSVLADGCVPDVSEPDRTARSRPTAPAGVDPVLFAQAVQALHEHGADIPRQDRIGIADFSLFSAAPRFHLIDLRHGTAHTLRVTHGSGSDPAHTGFLQHFSNRSGSNATSRGVYRTDDYYTGEHGRSQRLTGLDPTNDNAMDRAIVIHAAWYAEPEMIAQHGKLGRSQGCFAVAEADLDTVFAVLGQGRMLYAGRGERARSVQPAGAPELSPLHRRT